MKAQFRLLMHVNPYRTGMFEEFFKEGLFILSDKWEMVKNVKQCIVFLAPLVLGTTRKWWINYANGDSHGFFKFVLVVFLFLHLLLLLLLLHKDNNEITLRQPKFQSRLFSPIGFIYFSRCKWYICVFLLTKTIFVHVLNLILLQFPSLRDPSFIIRGGGSKMGDRGWGVKTFALWEGGVWK